MFPRWTHWAVVIKEQHSSGRKSPNVLNSGSKSIKSIFYSPVSDKHNPTCCPFRFKIFTEKKEMYSLTVPRWCFGWSSQHGTALPWGPFVHESLEKDMSHGVAFLCRYSLKEMWFVHQMLKRGFMALPLNRVSVLWPELTVLWPELTVLWPELTATKDVINQSVSQAMIWSNLYISLTFRQSTVSR